MAWGSALALGGSAFARQGRKPNVLLIIADDMGYSDAGCYGGEIDTPNLDRLASNGLRFSQCYSTGRCWPSRTCLLTGYYPQQVRMDPPQGPLPAWTRVVPALSQAARIPLLSRRQMAPDGGPQGRRRRRVRPVLRPARPRPLLQPEEPRAGRPQAGPVAEGSDFYVTTAIAGYAMDFLKEHAQEHRDEPFYCYLAFTSPHFPLHALQEDIDRYRDRYLAGMGRHPQAAMGADCARMGMVNCDLPPLEPDTIPSWNLPKEKLAEMIGPGEVDRAVPWTDLTEEQKKFQATKMAIHAAMIDRMDREIGRVLDQVKSMGVLDDTLILFVSDNGASAEQIIRGDMHDPTAPPGSAQILPVPGARAGPAPRTRPFACTSPGSTRAASPRR